MIRPRQNLARSLRHRLALALAAGASAMVLCAAGALPDGLVGPAWLRAGRNELCVTNGVVSAGRDGRLAIETPSARAVVRRMARSPDQAAQIRFRYLGPAATERPLASGTLRRQIGLKLQAEDSCNVVYVMWHIEPDTRLMVSIKRNPSLHSHAQCGAGGYTFVKPQMGADPPPIRVGESNTLRAELHGFELVVTVNDREAWRGTLAGPLPMGPVGFRTDNGRFLFEFDFADRGAAGALPPTGNQASCPMPERED